MMGRIQPFSEKPDFSQKGQALVEYILLVVISISLILALANQLYKPFNKWLNSYMGEYLQCLLDAGELPSLGYSAEESLCHVKFEPATLGNGRPAKGDKDGKGNDADKPPDESKAKRNSAASSGSSTSSAGSSSASSRELGFKIGGGGADGASEGEKQFTTEDSGGANKTRYLKTFTTAYDKLGEQQGGKYEAISGTINQERAKVKKREDKVRTIAGAASNELNRGAKFSIKPQEEKRAEALPDEPWTLGKWFRFLLILMIVVAVVLFLINQLTQMSKSMEK